MQASEVPPTLASAGTKVVACRRYADSSALSDNFYPPRSRGFEGRRIAMTEAEARALLANFEGVGGLENWIAAREWKAAPSGWAVIGELQGLTFRVEVIPTGLRLTATEPGIRPAVWEVPGSIPYRSARLARQLRRARA
jgi:hypothetical protein